MTKVQLMVKLVYFFLKFSIQILCQVEKSGANFEALHHFCQAQVKSRQLFFSLEIFNMFETNLDEGLTNC